MQDRLRFALFESRPCIHCPELRQYFYTANVDDGVLRVIVGQEPTEKGKLYHLSIGHVTKNNARGEVIRAPTRAEANQAIEFILPDFVGKMTEELPKAKDQYIKGVPVCIHYWQKP